MSITIVGGGISGLSLAYILHQKDATLDIKVLEARERPGGKIWTDRADGFLCESGVNGFLDNKPTTFDFIKTLSLEPLRSNDASRKRYIYRGGKLHRLPENPQAFFLSGLLTPCGKGRIIYELIAPKGRQEDESLASFATRRLGREVYEYFIDPMASGIYAGDATKLSLKSCFPRIYELERQYGSLIRAMIRLQKEAKKTGKKVGPSPGGVLTSFYDGMETVISALKEALADRIVTSKRVTGIDKRGSTYTVYTEDGQSFETEQVVLACPAHDAEKIFRELDPEVSGLMKKIPYPPVSVVCLGFRYEDIEYDINGFGFLVPSVEGRKILGTLWDSSIFPNRAPEGYVLFRTMLGGARQPDVALQDEQKLIDTVLSELKDIMNVDVRPEFARVYVHEKAIPQYNVGHSSLVNEIKKRIKERFSGLYLTGNAYGGVGFNDCIYNSYKLSDELMNDLTRQ